MVFDIFSLAKRLHLSVIFSNTMKSLNYIFNNKFIIAILLFLIQQLTAQAQVIVDISFEQPEHHLAKVQLKFETTNADYVNFYLLSWRTGRYKTLNHC